MAMLALSSLSNLISSFLPSRSPPNPLSNLHPKSIRLSKTTSECAPSMVAAPDRTLPSTSLSSSLMKADEITPIVCPSLAYSNTLFFSRYYNIEIVVEDDEPEEKLMNRLKAAVFRAGILKECKRRKFFESSREKRKRKSREAAQEAARTNRRRRPKRKASAQDKPEQPKKNYNSDDDTWELPEDLPY